MAEENDGLTRAIKAKRDITSLLECQEKALKISEKLFGKPEEDSGIKKIMEYRLINEPVWTAINAYHDALRILEKYFPEIK